MNLFKRFHKTETPIPPQQYIEAPVNEPPMPKTSGRPKKAPCEICHRLASQGRTGEIEGVFIDGDPYTFEIMNQQGIEGKECYTLFIQNDPAIGFNEMPISYCLKCGRKLGARMRE